jgi:predicted deacylase
MTGADMRETPGVRLDRLPLTYDECRARFRRAAMEAGVIVEAHPILARGPFGQELTIDVASLGADRPARALAVLSGVHGVEGFVNSALQCDLLARWDPSEWPRDVGVLLVHAVNPWGMAWWRRQNESNVDLNRNWRRSEIEPVHNDAYDELHHLACPDTDALPEVDGLLATASAVVAERGMEWVRDGITRGQYRHPDGLHYGGERTEESNVVLHRLVTERLAGVERLLTLDLHTGHGPRGEVTILSDQPPGSPQDAFFRSVFDRVEATTGNPDATTGPKSGQIANGFRDLFPNAECFSTSLEFGTASDLEQLAATYQEQWVHRHGDRSNPDHQPAVWAYRCCFTPDDPDWEASCLRRGREHLDAALAAVQVWGSDEPRTARPAPLLSSEQA